MSKELTPIEKLLLAYRRGMLSINMLVTQAKLNSPTATEKEMKAVAEQAIHFVSDPFNVFHDRYETFAFRNTEIARKAYIKIITNGFQAWLCCDPQVMTSINSLPRCVLVRISHHQDHPFFFDHYFADIVNAESSASPTQSASE